MEFTLADPGEGIHEVEILEVHVSSGDQVEDGDDLFTVESDKAITEVPASFDGRITEVRVSAGDTAEVGDVLLTYEAGGEAEEPSEREEEQDAPRREASEKTEEPEQPDGDEPDDEATGEAPPEQQDEPEEDTEPAEDAETAEEPEKEATTDAAAEGAGDGTHKPRGSRLVETHRPVPASPATRALADRLGVDLQEIEGSGPDGRVEPEDVQAAAEAEPQPQESAAEEGPEEKKAVPSGELPDFSRWGQVEHREIRGVRRATAEAMTESWRRIPHVSHMDVADITELEAARSRYAEEAGEGEVPLTLTVFLMKAVVAALRQHPEFNASLDEAAGVLILKKHYNIGVAVDTDAGLVVPVIRDVDSKPMSELASELVETAERMRQGDRQIQDFEGGTFTITNPGGIGGTSFTPIINHPEVAILGSAAATWQWVTDGPDSEPEARLHLPLVLAFDHRVVDGADAARFMNTVVGSLEDLPTLMIES